MSSVDNAQAGDVTAADRLKYVEALEICQAVQAEVLREDATLRQPIAAEEVHRLQNIFYISGGIRSYTDGAVGVSTVQDYIRAIEFVLSPRHRSHTDTQPRFKDLILATCLIGLILNTSIPDSLAHFMNDVGLGHSADPPDYLNAVSRNGGQLEQILSNIGSGALPLILLSPGLASQIPSLLFPSSSGALPAVCEDEEVASDGRLEAPLESVRASAHNMTGVIFLALAKVLQDHKPPHNSLLPGLSDSISISPSLILLVYYLAFAFSPSPSACNNMGILITSLPSTRVVDGDNSSRVLDSQAIAREYYERGLEMDPNHAHLLTNLGSLLREMGQIDDAVRCVVHTRSVNLCYSRS